MSGTFALFSTGNGARLALLAGMPFAAGGVGHANDAVGGPARGDGIVAAVMGLEPQADPAPVLDDDGKSHGTDMFRDFWYPDSVRPK